MAGFEIVLKYFGLFVRHAGGVTVVFPASNHTLLLDVDGRTMPVQGGCNIEIEGPDGQVLAGTKTAERDYDEFMVDVAVAEGRSIVVPAALIDRATPPDPSQVNGRCFLSGGTIVGEACSIRSYREPWKFAHTTHKVTDTVRWQHDVKPGETFRLIVNRSQAFGGEAYTADLRSGSTVTLHNEDNVGAPSSSFVGFDEYEKLLALVNVRPGAAPVYTGIHPKGWLRVCAHAGITIA